MGKIKILPEEVANKIAAGEVVERPASVVKELIENSLDAGSSRVTVEVENGGKSAIIVADDGCGMDRDEALLSLERHATSKISSAEDLFEITTFGFRGEALPSIAAVSRFDMVTRAEGCVEGTEVKLAGGKILKVSSVGCPRGTRISVRNLYFNVPARAKFLRSTTTELSHITDAVQRHSLVQLSVGFVLNHDGRTLFSLSPTESPLERIAHLFGPEFAQNLLPVALAQEGLQLTGFVMAPGRVAGKRPPQLFFLNRRPVSSPLLTHVLTQSYAGYLAINQLPAAILELECDPLKVDVNVHPAKREVKFHDPRGVTEFVTTAIRHALGQPSQPKPSVSRAQSTAPAEATMPLFRHKASARPGPLSFPETRTSRPVPPVPASSMPAPHVPAIPRVEAPPRHSTDLAGVLEPLLTEVPDTHGALLQAFYTYILISQDDRILFLDQHALQERLTYDELRSLSNGEAPSLQSILIPPTVELPLNLAMVLRSQLDLVSSLGISVSIFGENAFIVDGVHPAYDEGKVPELLREIAAEIFETEIPSDPGVRREELLRVALKACRTSIKAGQPLSQEEMQHMVRQLAGITPPLTCPHGRPIVLSLSKVELEKAFKRRL